MRLVLGVDGGATKTHALIGDETGRIRGLGSHGPGNHQAPGGIARAIACIAGAIENACTATGCSIDDLAHATFCLAGADMLSDFRMLEGALSERWPGLRLDIRNDTFAGLRAGTQQGWGVVSICGTGANAAGIAPDGRSFALPGLGYIYGDFGGGYDLGQEALRAVHQAAEHRGAPTALTPGVLSFLGYANVDELRKALYEGAADRGRIPQIAPLVFEAADAGDEVAQEILIRMGEEMGRSAAGVMRQLDLQGLAVEVVLAGSVWRGNNPLLIDSFRLAIHRVAPRATLVRPRYEPVVGAWLLAVETLGVKPDRSFLDTLEATLPPNLCTPPSPFRP